MYGRQEVCRNAFASHIFFVVFMQSYPVMQANLQFINDGKRIVVNRKFKLREFFSCELSDNRLDIFSNLVLIFFKCLIEFVQCLVVTNASCCPVQCPELICKCHNLCYKYNIITIILRNLCSLQVINDIRNTCDIFGLFGRDILCYYSNSIFIY